MGDTTSTLGRHASDRDEPGCINCDPGAPLCLPPLGMAGLVPVGCCHARGVIDSGIVDAPETSPFQQKVQRRGLESAGAPRPETSRTMPGRVKRVVTHTAIEHVESHDQGKSNRRSSRISEPAKHAGSLKAKHGTHDDPADETQ